MQMYWKRDFDGATQCLKAAVPDRRSDSLHLPVLSFLCEQLALSLKNRVCPDSFHCTEYIFTTQDFQQLCACPVKLSLL